MNAFTESDGFYQTLPCGRSKIIVESKTIGITVRDTKVLRTDEHTRKHHRHW